MTNLLKEINPQNLNGYFDSILSDADDRKSASLRHAIWRDLKYKLWKLSEEDFEEAIAAIRALIDRYDGIAENKAEKNQEKLRGRPNNRDQQSLLKK